MGQKDQRYSQPSAALSGVFGPTTVGENIQNHSTVNGMYAIDIKVSLRTSEITNKNYIIFHK